MDLPLQLQELLPSRYSYKVKQWITFEKEPTHFDSVILTNIYTEEEAQEWWHEFNVKSNTTMRVRATCPKTGRVNVFKIYLRCLHQGRSERTEKLYNSQKSKSILCLKRNTNCPAGMVIAIRRVVKYSRSKKRDPVDPVHPCEIQIRFVHNHPIKTADSLRFRPVSKEAEEKILSLYRAGHSPSSALDLLKIDLQIEHGSLFSEVISDRYYCPDRSFCYRLYYKHFGKDYGSSSKFNPDTQSGVHSLLSSEVSRYNNLLGDACLATGTVGSEYAIAACTPLMKRSHSLCQSGDIVYVELYECPANKDRYEHNVILLNAHTSAGGVPLGAVITTSNSRAVLTLGFQLLKELLPDTAFGGRGTLGPHAFFTEDSDNQRSALNTVWPDSDVVICIFRMLQSMWRWLWNEKNNILKDHRVYLLYLLKTVLFASSDSEMTTKYQAACSDGIIAHYPAYLHQLESLWQRRLLWGICFHRVLPLPDASNYYEAAVRALKDKTLDQARSFNIIQLLNYLVTRLDFFYKTKFLKILQGKIKHIFLSYYPDSVPPHIVHNIKQIAENYYVVPNEAGEDKFYTVDAELNCCSCPNGLCGALCIHQYWVFLKVPSDIFKADISDLLFKQKLFTVASGTSVPCPLPLLNAAVELTNPNSNTNTTPMENSQSVIAENTVSDEPKLGLVDMFNNSEALPTCAEITVKPSSAFTDVVSASVPMCSDSVPVTSDGPVSAESPANSTAVSSVSQVSEEKIESRNLSVSDKTDAAKTICENSKLDSRKVKALEDFDKFCQKVRDGLKNQAEEFLPALEIMMKNIERKGNSADQIISGLSFFGVVSAPSLTTKAKKRVASTFFTEEIVPKVYGRQMITYGRKKFIDQVKITPQSQTSVINVSEISKTTAADQKHIEQAL